MKLLHIPFTLQLHHKLYHCKIKHTTQSLYLLEEYCPLGFDVVVLLQQVLPKQWHVFTKLYSITFLIIIIFILNTTRT
jgi:hypothetical protein